VRRRETARVKKKLWTREILEHTAYNGMFNCCDDPCTRALNERAGVVAGF
jgi:hypothetical protein